MRITPCYDVFTKTDCPNRKPGCNGKCEKWNDYVKKRNEDYRKRMISCDAHDIIYSHREKEWLKWKMRMERLK